MATNKNALIRYRTIDKCLQNSGRRWSLEDLIEACSEALYEYEGKDANVSKRTVQLDIQLLRSDKLGYNAPIEVYERKYYRYADPDFSITDIPLRSDDLDVISESVAMLRQFKDFSLFAELNGVIQKLEDKIHHETDRSEPIIHLDKNEELRGLEHLDTLYQAISKKIVVRITYQSFSARMPATFSFAGFILKEYNNRWFLVGRKLEYPTILTLALDRIYAVTLNLKADYPDYDFKANEYYKNTFGVTVLNERPAKVELLVDRRNAPYVLTKPLHTSQQLISQRDNGSILISLEVHLNYEFERLILGFGDSITVLKPAKLRKRIVGKLRNAINKYDKD